MSALNRKTEFVDSPEYMSKVITDHSDHSSDPHHKASSQCSKRRSKYQIIDSDLRMRLLKLVDEENMTIKQASDLLNVKYSTAKTILQLF